MTLAARDVTAIIVTRGNVDLRRILRTLPYEDVVVWNNSKRDVDAKTYGRHLALDEAKHSIVYTQDDDIIFNRHQELLAAYEPGVLAGSMDARWSKTAARHVPGGYSDLIFPGAGSVYDARVARDAIGRYLDVYPDDDFFRLWCDCVVGVLAPHKNVHLPHRVLPCARAAYRVCRQPRAHVDKAEAIRRAREIRDGTV